MGHTRQINDSSERRTFIGGSDARIIMGDDVAGLERLSEGQVDDRIVPVFGAQTFALAEHAAHPAAGLQLGAGPGRERHAGYAIEVVPRTPPVCQLKGYSLSNTWRATEVRCSGRNVSIMTASSSVSRGRSSEASSAPGCGPCGSPPTWCVKDPCLMPRRAA